MLSHLFKSPILILLASINLKMNKMEYRAIIKFFVMEGLSTTEIHKKILKVLKEDAPSFSTIHRWASQFRRGHTTIEDDPRSGRPKTATTPQIIQKIHDMVLDDRRLKVREIASAAGISAERVWHILHEDLKMRKLCARWVPHLLTIDEKRIRMKFSQSCLDRLNLNETDFMSRIVTIDETWIHHYTPETTAQSKQWVEAGSSAPKSLKKGPSAGKVMASVFWDSKGILLLDYLEKGKTITSAYYVSLLNQLNDKIREKRSGLKKKKIIFLQDNAPAHKSFLTITKLNDLKYDLLDHPPYSPDLAPSDFFLFTNLKKFLSGKRFRDNQEAIDAVNGYFESLDEKHYKQGMELLKKRWTQCVELKGDFVEK